MLKRQRPSSPPPILAAYGDDLSSPILGPNTFHAATSMSTPSIQVDPSSGISRKRPRIPLDVTPGVAGMGGGASVGRHTFFSSSVLSKRGRSPDPMDDDDEDGPESKSHPQISGIYSGYQREGESSDPTASRPTINPKRRRTTAPTLEGSSRGWGVGQHFETEPDDLDLTSHPYPFDPVDPPPGWVLETQIGEYAQENARLHNLHTLRPRLPHSAEATQDHDEISNADVDMEEKVVKERYEERNRYAVLPLDAYIVGHLTTCIRLLGSLFLERQRRLAGS